MEDLLSIRVYGDGQTRGHSAGLWIDPIWEALSQQRKQNIFVRSHDRLSQQFRRARVWAITSKELCLKYDWRNQFTVTVAVRMNSINFEIIAFNLRTRWAHTIQYDSCIKYGSKSCIRMRKPKSSPSRNSTFLYWVGLIPQTIPLPLMDNNGYVIVDTYMMHSWTVFPIYGHSQGNLMFSNQRSLD